jgi:hypothetical protein
MPQVGAVAAIVSALLMGLLVQNSVATIEPATTVMEEVQKEAQEL